MYFGGGNYDQHSALGERQLSGCYT